METRPDTFQCIYERRSTRTFIKGKKIPDDVLGKILDSARYAPTTPTGDYPWRLLVVRDQDTKLLIANCAQEITRVVFGGSYEMFSEHLWYMPRDTRLRVAEYTTSGELWISRDEGRQWESMASHLPEIYAVETAEVV